MSAGERELVTRLLGALRRRIPRDSHTNSAARHPSRDGWRQRMSTIIDCGDTVKHGPTGETWLVACVEGNRLYWCGWPPGSADLSDCTLVEKATPEARAKLIRELASKSGDDARCVWARNQPEATAATPPETEET